MRRLPLYVGDEFDTTDAPQLIFEEMVDIKGGDTVVFDDGSYATVNGVSPIEMPNGRVGCVVILGDDPTTGPRKHSGKAPPIFKADGVTPYGSNVSSVEEGE